MCKFYFVPSGGPTADRRVELSEDGAFDAVVRFLSIKFTNPNPSRLEPVYRLDVVNERFANACQPVISDHLESVSEYLNLPFPPICPEA